MQLRKLCGLEDQVTEHTALNQCKGTVVSIAMSNSTIEEQTEALVECRNTQKYNHLQQARSTFSREKNKLAFRTKQPLYPNTHALPKLSAHWTN